MTIIGIGNSYRHCHPGILAFYPFTFAVDPILRGQLIFRQTMVWLKSLGFLKYRMGS